MTSSTTSSESAPRSFTNEVSRLIFSAGWPRLSLTILITRSSTDGLVMSRFSSGGLLARGSADSGSGGSGNQGSDGPAESGSGGSADSVSAGSVSEGSSGSQASSEGQAPVD